MNGALFAQRAAISGGAMLYDPSRVGNASEELFRLHYWRARATVSSTPAGRGHAQFIESEGRNWVLRHYRRGGWAARLSVDTYLWTGEDRTRPFREWRLLAELHRAGLPVPAPVAACYRRRGLGYTGNLITERIPRAQPLSAALAHEPLPHRMWEAIGQCVRRFHDAGIYHADLNGHNILLSEAGVFLVDFDRGRRRRAGAWQKRNLARLQRSLTKVARKLPVERFTVAEWAALLHGYVGTISRASA